MDIRMNRRLSTKSLFLVLLAFGVTFPFFSSLADREAPPNDYVQATTDGRYVFVMLVPEDLQGATLPSVEIAKRIRKRYPCSGMYRKEDPRIPLWTVDWYSFTVYPSTDGIHLAQLRTWPDKDEYDIAGVIFYRNGQKLEEFTVRQLIKDLDILPLTVSHYHWLKQAQWEDFGLFAVETLTGEKRVFNPSRMKGPGREPPQVTCRPNSLYK
jgi:hypothetical protein